MSRLTLPSPDRSLWLFSAPLSLGLMLIFFAAGPCAWVRAAEAPKLAFPKIVVINEDSEASEVELTVSDPDSELNLVTITPGSNNAELLPVSQLTITGTGANRKLSLTPLPNASGSATITLTASDGANNREHILLVRVNAVNDAPSFDLDKTSVKVSEDAGLTTLSGFAKNIVVGPANESSQRVTFTVTTSQKDFYSTPPKIDPAGTLTFAAASNKAGTDTLVVRMIDSGGTAFGGNNRAPDKTFTLEVEGSNDAPLAVLPKPLILAEDSEATLVEITLSDPDSDLSAATLGLTVDNTELFPPNKVALTGAGDKWQLSLTPAPNAFGTATFTFAASDGLATREQTWLVKVNGVNDAPSFELSKTSLKIAEDAGLVKESEFVKEISVGPTNEASQRFSFTVATSNPAFYTILPKIDSAGALTFRAAENQTGTDSLTVSMLDSGGTSFGGTNKAPEKTFALEIEGTNDAPLLALPALLSINEDSDPTLLELAVSDPDSDPALAVITRSVDNTELFPLENVLVTGTGAKRQLSLKPAANAFGQAVLTFTVSDGSASREQNLPVKVNPVNDPPSFALAQEEVEAVEDAGLVKIEGFAKNISFGPANESDQRALFTVTTTKKDFYATPPKIDAAGALTFRTAEDRTGTDTLVVGMTDTGGTNFGGNNKAADLTFTLKVQGVNDPPLLVLPRGVTLSEDSEAVVLEITVSDVDGEAGLALITPSVTNTDLFALDKVVLTGTGAKRQLSLTPSANAFGQATLHFLVSDGTATREQSLPVRVNPVNDAPSFELAQAQVKISEDAGTVVINEFVKNLSMGPANEADQRPTFTVTTSNKEFYSAPPRIDAAGTLTFRVADDRAGTDTLVVGMIDNGGTSFGGVNKAADRSFTLEVEAANDAPRLSLPRPITLNEDSPATVFELTASDPDGSASLITVTRAVDNTDLFDLDKVVLTGSAGQYQLSLTPKADAFGLATLTFTVSDGTVSREQTLLVKVNPVNDAPSFELAKASLKINEDAGVVKETGFVKNIVLGPANEASQRVTFTVTPSNKSFYSVLPKIDPEGTLSFRVADDQTGTDSLVVSMTDNGGTAFGGISKAPDQTFTLEVDGANDPPSLVLPRTLILNEDSEATTADITVSDPDSGLGSAVVTFVVSNTEIFPEGKVTLTGTGAKRVLSLTPAPNAFGLATITFSSSDGTATKEQTLLVRVNAVNDPPSFSLSQEVVKVNKEAGLVRITDFAKEIVVGPPNETGQRVTFTLTTTKKEFYATLPKIDSSGALTFRLSSGAAGKDKVVVSAIDSGGTSFGGNNKAANKEFEIEVLAAGAAALAQRKNKPAERRWVTVRPALSAEVLANPFKGFFTEAENASSLTSLPQSLFLAEITWAELEAVRGRFDWEKFESGWQPHVDLGRKAIIRVSLDHPARGGPVDIPSWLAASSALRPYELGPLKGLAPDWDNEALLADYGRLITALANRYDADARVAWIEGAEPGISGAAQFSSQAAHLPAHDRSKMRVRHAYAQAFQNKFIAGAASTAALEPNPLRVVEGLPARTFISKTSPQEPALPWLARKGSPQVAAPRFSREPVSVDAFLQNQEGGHELLADRFEELVAWAKKMKLAAVGPTILHVNPPLEWRQPLARLHNLLGYHLSVVELNHPAVSSPEEDLPIQVTFRNDGLAAFPYAWPVEIALIRESGKLAYAQTLSPEIASSDIRTWGPGHHTLEAKLRLPKSLRSDRYRIAISILDPQTDQPAVQLGNAGRAASGRFLLSELELLE